MAPTKSYTLSMVPDADGYTWVEDWTNGFEHWLGILFRCNNGFGSPDAAWTSVGTGDAALGGNYLACDHRLDFNTRGVGGWPVVPMPPVFVYPTEPAKWDGIIRQMADGPVDGVAGDSTHIGLGLPYRGEVDYLNPQPCMIHPSVDIASGNPPLVWRDPGAGLTLDQASTPVPLGEALRIQHRWSGSTPFVTDCHHKWRSGARDLWTPWPLEVPVLGQTGVTEAHVPLLEVLFARTNLVNPAGHVTGPFTTWWIMWNALARIGRVRFAGERSLGIGAADYFGWEQWDLSSMTTVSQAPGLEFYHILGGLMPMKTCGHAAHSYYVSGHSDEDSDDGGGVKVGHAAQTFSGNSPAVVCGENAKFRSLWFSVHGQTEHMELRVRYADDDSLVSDTLIPGNSAGLIASGTPRAPGPWRPSGSYYAMPETINMLLTFTPYEVSLANVPRTRPIYVAVTGSLPGTHTHSEAPMLNDCVIFVEAVVPYTFSFEEPLAVEQEAVGGTVRLFGSRLPSTTISVT